MSWVLIMQSMKKICLIHKFHEILLLVFVHFELMLWVDKLLSWKFMLKNVLMSWVLIMQSMKKICLIHKFHEILLIVFVHFELMARVGKLLLCFSPGKL